MYRWTKHVEIGTEFVYKLLNIRYPFGNEDFRVASASRPPTMQVKQKWASISVLSRAVPGQSVMSTVQCFPEEGPMERQWVNLLLLLSLEASGNLDPRLYSGEYRKWLWFSFSPVTSDNGPFVTLVSVYFMGTETWDEIGRYQSHKAFLHTRMERGRGVQRPHNGRTWMEQAAWCNKEQWLESARVTLVSSFLPGTSHWPSTPDPIHYKSKMLSPPCLPRVIMGSKWQDDVKMLRKQMESIQMEVIIKHGVKTLVYKPGSAVRRSWAAFGKLISVFFFFSKRG